MRLHLLLLLLIRKFGSLHITWHSHSVLNASSTSCLDKVCTNHHHHHHHYQSSECNRHSLCGPSSSKSSKRNAVSMPSVCLFSSISVHSANSFAASTLTSSFTAVMLWRPSTKCRCRNRRRRRRWLGLELVLLC